MNERSAKIRWLMDQCYEIVLPGGRHLLIDPGLPLRSEAAEGKPSVDDIERCDYVLVSHSHYTATSALGYLDKKFHPVMFLGELCAEALGRYFDLDFSKLYAMSDSQRFELEDFSFTSYQGRHGGSKHYQAKFLKYGETTNGELDYAEIGLGGVVQNMDFAITLSNNLRLMFVSGPDTLKNVYTVAKDFAPNVLLRQLIDARPEKYAELIAGCGAEAAILGHHDAVFKFRNDDPAGIPAFAEAVRRQLEALGAPTTLVDPAPGKWYRMGAAVEAE